MIVATAGHVDHGKTSLVRALTGEDTDRLPEEKRRGMSIDLGIAYMAMPGGEPLAFVDVPGHENFVRNMAAGIPGIDLALLVVAADDGPMPQTREHLAIVDALGAPRLLAVLTKIDRVPPERVAQAGTEAQALLAAGRFSGADILPISSVSGEGMEALRARLALEAGRVQARPSHGRFRMHVDRAFVIDGLGLVATGTVLSGRIAMGDELQVLPRGLATRVRSLRANHGEAAFAVAGQRCALALQGLSRGDVDRGDSIADPGPAPRARSIDVAIEPLPDAGRYFSKRCQVGVHLGTAQYAAQAAPLSREGPLYARLAFPREISTWHGERFLVRDPGTRRLVGAGTVIDPMPPERGAARRQRLALLGSVEGRDAAQALDALLDVEPGMVDTAWLACAWQLSSATLREIEATRALAVFTLRKLRYVMRRDRWDGLCAALERSVAEWHAAQPESVGPRTAELPPSVAPTIESMLETGRMVREGPHLRLPGHRPILSAEDEALWQTVVPLLAGEGGRPPRVHELAAALAMEPKAVADFLQRAARAGRVHGVASNRFFLPAALDALVDLAVTLERESGDAGFGAAVYRDRSGLGRNLTIQVLEFLDASGCTRRSGEFRRVRPPYMEENRPRWDARTSNPWRGV